MRIAFGVIFVTGIFGGFFGDNASASPVHHHHVISKDLDDTTADKMNKPYISISVSFTTSLVSFFFDRGDDHLRTVFF
jgi:hypothetical protein